MKWKNCIKHSICINYIAPLINTGVLSSSSRGSSAARGIELKATLQAIILEAAIRARGAPKTARDVTEYMNIAVF